MTTPHGPDAGPQRTLRIREVSSHRMPEPLLQDLSRRLVVAAQEAFGEHLRGAIAKGSAVKGGFVPYFSDFDLHLFVAQEAMLGWLKPRLEYALAFQERIGPLPPADYQVSQCQVLCISWDTYPEGWTPPLPGTYRVLFGGLPPHLQHVSPHLVRQHAAQFFQDVPRQIKQLINRMLDKPDAGLPAVVRLLGTSIKPAGYHALALLHTDPLAVWSMPLGNVLAWVEPLACPTGGLSAFLDAVQP